MSSDTERISPRRHYRKHVLVGQIITDGQDKIEFVLGQPLLHGRSFVDAGLPDLNRFVSSQHLEIDTGCEYQQVIG